MAKFSFIIPCAQKDQKFLKRCLLSLQEQDYKDWDAVVVTDGFKLSEKFKDQFSEDTRFRMPVTIKEPLGASAARNKGILGAAGDYFWFLDADSWLMPGILRLVKDEFDKNPEADFVYGGYRWNVESLNAFPSRQWDPWLLGSMNYISTMSPMKRHVLDKLGGFAEDLPFFQDWDFWLRAATEGFTGHYLQEVMFMTEETRPDSISGNRKIPFRDRVFKIEERHGIDPRPIVVTSLAATHQGIERAQALNARYIGAHPRSPHLQLPSQFDLGHRMVLLQGFFPMAAPDHMNAIKMPKGVLRVVNWIGTDVWQLARNFSWAHVKRLKATVFSKIDVHTCNSEVLQKELAEMGIEAAVIPPPLCVVPKATPLPAKFAVSAYFTEENPMHCIDLVMDVAKSMPDVRFLMFGGPMARERDKNVEFLGWKPVQEVIDESSMHLRITIHDGWPMTPIQFMVANRPVVCNFPLPYANQVSPGLNDMTYANDKAEIVRAIRSVQSGKTKTPVGAKDHYMKLMDPVKYRHSIETILKRGKDFKPEDLNGVRKPSKSDLRASDVSVGAVVARNA